MKKSIIMVFFVLSFLMFVNTHVIASTVSNNTVIKVDTKLANDTIRAYRSCNSYDANEPESVHEQNVLNMHNIMIKL